MFVIDLKYGSLVWAVASFFLVWVGFQVWALGWHMLFIVGIYKTSSFLGPYSRPRVLILATQLSYSQDQAYFLVLRVQEALSGLQDFYDLLLLPPLLCSDIRLNNYQDYGPMWPMLIPWVAASSGLGKRTCCEMSVCACDARETHLACAFQVYLPRRPIEAAGAKLDLPVQGGTSQPDTCIVM